MGHSSEQSTVADLDWATMGMETLQGPAILSGTFILWKDQNKNKKDNNQNKTNKKTPTNLSTKIKCQCLQIIIF